MPTSFSSTFCVTSGSLLFLSLSFLILKWGNKTSPTECFKIKWDDVKCLAELLLLAQVTTTTTTLNVPHSSGFHTCRLQPTALNRSYVVPQCTHTHCHRAVVWTKVNDVSYQTHILGNMYALSTLYASHRALAREAKECWIGLSQ